MIPIYKLDRLPRTQKLRKIAKYFSFAERRLFETKKPNIITASEYDFFLGAAKLLVKDEQFPAEARKIFEQAVYVFENAMIPNNNPSPQPQVPCPKSLAPDPLLRTLNNVKHLLLTATGNEVADWDFTAFDGRLDPVKRQIFSGMTVYLEDIRSPFNVGAMFRTAESFGVEKIILSPFCADPLHRRAQRTAMGCIDIVPWERQELFQSSKTDCSAETALITRAGTGSYEAVFALETGGTPLSEFPFPRRGILIVGSEELGVSPRALEAADASLGRVSIPCYGAKASLNVSVAFGIALQAWASAITSDTQSLRKAQA